MRQRFRSEAGLTLIEILVVTLIIGVLAAIVTPTILNQQNRGEKARAESVKAAAAAKKRATERKQMKLNGVESIVRYKRLAIVRLDGSGTVPTPRYLYRVCGDKGVSNVASIVTDAERTTTDMVVMCRHN